MDYFAFTSNLKLLGEISNLLFFPISKNISAQIQCKSRIQRGKSLCKKEDLEFYLVTFFKKRLMRQPLLT